MTTMKSGIRLEQAIVAAERDSVEGPACPKAASKAPEDANVRASDTGWVAKRNKHWLQVMAEHTVARGWSYYAEAAGPHDEPGILEGMRKEGADG